MISVRHAEPGDMAFVRSAWFQSFWHETMREKEITFEDYKVGQNRRMDRLIDAGETLVAYAADVPDEILGFAVFGDDTLHYVYVKTVYRRRGIATGLIRSRAKSYSCKTPLFRKMKMQLQYNPYAVEDFE